MPDTITPNYTKEEIDNAKKELAAMKPEDLLNLQTELEIAQDAVELPEAPAIAFMELRAPSGSKINLTVRAGNGKLVLDSLASAVAHARDRYGMVTVGTPMSQAPVPMEQPPLPNDESPQVPLTSAPNTGTPQPTYVPITIQSSTIEIPVESLTRERKRDMKGDFLRVRGGRYTKFGVPCYPEHFPQGLDVTQMQYGVEFTNIPPSMKVAVVTDAKPYHVVNFHG